MITAPFDYTAPATLPAALGLLARPGSVPLAGGMSLIPELKHGDAAPSLLVDLRKIRALRDLDPGPDGSVRIGAMTAVADIAAHRGIPAALAEAAGAIPDPHVRYQSTIGGNLATAGLGSDLPPVLLALDASVTLATADGDTTMSAGQFLRERPAGLLTSVDVPALGTGEACVSERISDRPARPPRLVVAVWARLEAGGRLGACRLAAGAAGTPRRLPRVEAALAGGRPDTRRVAAACEHVAVADLLDGQADPESGDYLRHLTGVLAERAFGRILAAA